LPLALLHTRAGAEALIGIVDVAFLLQTLRTRDLAWLTRPWTAAALAFWSWLVLCSTVGPGGAPSLVQALLAIRFFLFAAALGDWVLVPRAMRRWLWLAVAASAAWIALEAWQQYLLGRNLFGMPRWEDGALTGPFKKPRAGAAFALVLLPSLLPPAARLLAGGWARRIGGSALLAAGAATIVLIGQRMPVLLALLGLLVCAALLRRFRPALAGAIAAGALLLAATPVLSPPTFNKLVVHFGEQIGHFPASSYGLLYTRAVAMTAANPVFGLGVRGFRRACGAPQYDAGIPALGIPDTRAGPAACNLHPHNFYLEASTAAGLPGLVLFAALALVWIAALGRGLLRHPEPLRVGLFATAVMALWPLASTSEFFSVPNCGWLFLVLGWGFAESGSLLASGAGHTPAIISR
jgi:O-antigen ligase